nr:hypothetical protein B11C_110112 [Bartonella sp. 1-1C]
MTIHFNVYEEHFLENNLSFVYLCTAFISDIAFLVIRIVLKSNDIIICCIGKEI